MLIKNRFLRAQCVKRLFDITTREDTITCALAVVTLLAIGAAAPAEAMPVYDNGGIYLDTVRYDNGGRYPSGPPGFGGDPAHASFNVGPTEPGKWGPPAFGTGATVTWSLMPSGLIVDGRESSSIALSEFMPQGFKDALFAAFDAWSDVADITFIKKPDPRVGWVAPGAAAVDIRITGHPLDGSFGVLAHTFFPPKNGPKVGGGWPLAGDIHFDSEETWALSFDAPGFSIFQVAAHEIGHAIGLAHSDVSNSLMNPIYSEDFRGPQADDIAGVQYIYGTVVAAPPTLALLAVAMPGLLGFLWRTSRRGAA